MTHKAFEHQLNKVGLMDRVLFEVSFRQVLWERERAQLAIPRPENRLGVRSVTLDALGVHPVRRHELGRMVHGSVPVPEGPQALVDLQFIGLHAAPAAHVLPDEGLNGVGLEAGHPETPDAAPRWRMPRTGVFPAAPRPRWPVRCPP